SPDSVEIFLLRVRSVGALIKPLLKPIGSEVGSSTIANSIHLGSVAQSCFRFFQAKFRAVKLRNGGEGRSRSPSSSCLWILAVGAWNFYPASSKLMTILPKEGAL